MEFNPCFQNKNVNLTTRGISQRCWVPCMDFLLKFNAAVRLFFVWVVHPTFSITVINAISTLCFRNHQSWDTWTVSLLALLLSSWSHHVIENLG